LSHLEVFVKAIFLKTQWSKHSLIFSINNFYVVQQRIYSISLQLFCFHIYLCSIDNNAHYPLIRGLPPIRACEGGLGPLKPRPLETNSNILLLDLYGYKTLINDQQHECYSFLTQQDNFILMNLISINKIYNFLANFSSKNFLSLQDNFSFKRINFK
jgi:hypothetical protein